MDIEQFRIRPGKEVNLAKYDPAFRDGFKDKAAAQQKLDDDIAQMVKLQDVFYADGKRSLLLIFQALDAAGKDGTIKHVMSGINPQGCQVASFKSPSTNELAHNFLWRCNLRLPARGHIGIFNRSYYEEVLIVRVHPEFLDAQNLPPECLEGDVWKHRFRDINNFERHLVGNGTTVLKFFLHISKDEQRKRFLDRIDRPEKNWKFSPADIKERAHWDDYQHAFEDMLANTSTDWAPWYIIPSNHKWFARAAVSEIIVETLKSFDLRYPQLDATALARLAEAKQILLAEK